MQVEELIKQYLDQIKVMQLATALDNQPWVCNIHFYADDGLNLYWVSTPTREHSQHIAQNPKVAATILAHENTPAENYVIGISLAGTAELVGTQVAEEIGSGFVRKHAKASNLLADIASGQNPHQFYRLVPTKIVLFDTKNFPNDPRQELNL